MSETKKENSYSVSFSPAYFSVKDIFPTFIVHPRRILQAFKNQLAPLDMVMAIELGKKIVLVMPTVLARKTAMSKDILME